MIKSANQPIMARFGETVWITDFITPQNPDVILMYQKYVRSDPRETIWNLWQFVATLPYAEMIPCSLNVPGVSIQQPDTWFYPAETIQMGISNCANRSFLLTSLLKNLTPDVLCVLGQVGGGNHAWVQISVNGGHYYIETTNPYLQDSLQEIGAPFDPFIYFDETEVFITEDKDPRILFNGKFREPGAIGWLDNYLSVRALPLINS